ncbi:hypothetical protein E2C01_039868 [Portunus trituberculatus]|uniref:Uncharacterized protein n=1 Tax=Portunus trituberculatus TaxID=210409 RepID=A0A5B7FLU0_PORTR|nr:hypothetical protein [Portunus trituberculatus]
MSKSNPSKDKQRYKPQATQHCSLAPTALPLQHDSTRGYRLNAAVSPHTPAAVDDATLRQHCALASLSLTTSVMEVPARDKDARM